MCDFLVASDIWRRTGNHGVVIAWAGATREAHREHKLRLTANGLRFIQGNSRLCNHHIIVNLTFHIPEQSLNSLCARDDAPTGEFMWMLVKLN